MQHYIITPYYAVKPLGHLDIFITKIKDAYNHST